MQKLMLYNGVNKAISQFNWQGSFTNLPINEQVNIFNSTLMNIFSNFIPNKIVTFKDQDPPLYCENIKAKIELKNDFTRNTLKMVDEKIFIIYCKI